MIIKSRLFCKDCNSDFRQLNTKGKLHSSYCARCNIKRVAHYRITKPADYRSKEYHRRKAKVGTSGPLKKYGLTPEQFQEMLKRQDSKCAICGNHQQYRQLSIDHCHKTGKVRGLLCTSCNRGIGYFYDSPYRLKNAAKYLE